MPRRFARLGLPTLAVALMLTATTARGQVPVPQPSIPVTEARSGLLTRFVPIQPGLPVDRKRDKFYDTRWADRPDMLYPGWKYGGECGSLYGLRWYSDCSRSFYPFFRGYPGASTLRPDCKPCHPWSRWYQNFIHPAKPVCHYYAGGSLVPVYDFDPWVTGPGPFPWPWFWRRPLGG
ncbi:MAG: hypothetical protein IRY99_22650 [Isosphaeraceae bacterium]|nr:hypothetical protein [Isosphaeraceae bacterium]